MMTLERPGGPPSPPPGPDDGSGPGGNGQPGDDYEPRLWPLLALALALLAPVLVLALLVPPGAPCHLAVSAAGRAHYVLACP